MVNLWGSPGLMQLIYLNVFRFLITNWKETLIHNDASFLHRVLPYSPRLSNVIIQLTFAAIFKTTINNLSRGLTFLLYFTKCLCGTLGAHLCRFLYCLIIPKSESKMASNVLRAIIFIPMLITRVTHWYLPSAFLLMNIILESSFPSFVPDVQLIWPGNHLCVQDKLVFEVINGLQPFLSVVFAGLMSRVSYL